MMSSLPQSVVSCLKRRRSELVVLSSVLLGGCVTHPARYQTLSAPPDVHRTSHPPYQGAWEEQKLTARAVHLRVHTVERMLLAISLADEAGLEALLAPHCQLSRDQRSTAATARSILQILRAEQEPDSQRRAPPMFQGRHIAPDGADSGRLVLEVTGPHHVSGRWTVVFLDSPVNKIKEIRLPPSTS